MLRSSPITVLLRSFAQGGAPSDSPKAKWQGVGTLERLVLKRLAATDGWVARPDDAQEARMLAALPELSQKMNVDPPKKLVIYDSKKPNAAMLANGTVVVSTELMRILTHEQMDAVLAHELSHHKHGQGDRFMMLSLAIGACLGMGWIRHKWFKPSSELLPNIRDIVVDLEAMNLAVLPYAAMMETRADREGAQAVSPEAMAESLIALEKRTKEIRKEEYQKKYGPNADPDDANWLVKGWRSFVRAHDPHPYTKDRVAALGYVQTREAEKTHPTEMAI